MALSIRTRLRHSPVGAAYRYSRTLRSWIALFSDVGSIHNYRSLHKSQGDRSTYGPRAVSPTPMRVRPLHGQSVYCRPGTTDINVFDDTFRGLYHLPPKDIAPIRTVLDLGSNIGLTIAHYATLYPQARILGIELDHDNLQICQQNILPYADRCTVFWGAAWSHDGEVTYGGNSEWGYRVETTASRRAPAYSISSLIQRFGVPKVDFVKMDVEGAEKDLLANSHSWIHQVRCVKIEIHEPYSVDACVRDLGRVGLQCEIDTKHRACVIARPIKQ